MKKKKLMREALLRQIAALEALVDVQDEERDLLDGRIASLEETVCIYSEAAKKSLKVADAYQNMLGSTFDLLDRYQTIFDTAIKAADAVEEAGRVTAWGGLKPPETPVEDDGGGVSKDTEQATFEGELPNGAIWWDTAPAKGEGVGHGG